MSQPTNPTTQLAAITVGQVDAEHDTSSAAERVQSPEQSQKARLSRAVATRDDDY